MQRQGRDVFGCGLVPAVVIGMGLLAAGCSQRDAVDAAIARAAREAGQSRQDTARFAGRVTVDGLAPPANTLVVLYDPKAPPLNGARPLHAYCKADGRFEFTTYVPGDGVPSGSYVVLFVTPQPRDDPGSPTGLKNLYNDPDKNSQLPEFNVEVKPPGKTSYQFELAVAGKDPVTTPGPNAVTSIGFRGR